MFIADLPIVRDIHHERIIAEREKGMRLWLTLYIHSSVNPVITTMVVEHVPWLKSHPGQEPRATPP